MITELTSRKEINETLHRARMTNPIVADIVEHYALHVPKKIAISNVAAELNSTTDLIKSTDTIGFIAGQFALFGEAFVSNNLDEHTCTWSSFHIQNPQFISTTGNVTGKQNFFLHADDRLKKAIKNGQAENLAPEVISCVKKNKPIPLHDYYFTAFLNKMHPYDLRGTSQFLPFINKLDELSYAEAKLLFPTQLKLDRIANMIAQWLQVKVYLPLIKLNNIKDIPKIELI